MKKTGIATALMFVSSLLLVPATFAAGEEADGQEKMTQEQYQGQFQQQKSSLILTDHLIGTEILNQNNETIGTIENVLMDARTGQVGYVLVAGGGVIGLGEEKYIVPFNALQPRLPEGQEFGTGQPDLREMVYSLTTQQDQLKQVEGDIETALTDQELLEINDYYGVSPYWEENGVVE